MLKGKASLCGPLGGSNDLRVPAAGLSRWHVADVQRLTRMGASCIWRGADPRLSWSRGRWGISVTMESSRIMSRLFLCCSPLYNSFQDTSQVQILSGIWPKEMKYGPIENLGITSKTWVTGPHLPLSKIKLFSVRPSVVSVYPTLYSHGIVPHFWGFKNKVD